MPKETKTQVLCGKISDQSSLECQPPESQRDNRTTESSAHTGQSFEERMQFNDMNVDCIEHIFSFLTATHKLNFRKVCSTWKTMFEQFWRLENLKVLVDGEDPYSSEEETMEMADFDALLKIGGHHLKSLNMLVFCDKELRVRINAEEYFIIGKFNFCDLLKVIAEISTDIQSFVCNFDLSDSEYRSSVLAVISELISRNRKMKCFKLEINYSLAKYLKLKDLPETIEDFGIIFFARDAPAIYDWLSVAKNLTSLSFKEYNFSNFTSEILRCVRYDRAMNIKVLRLEVHTGSPSLLRDMQRTANMTSLEELHMTFPCPIVETRDDFLVAISSGCKKLKKLHLENCTFTCEGMNPILSELDLTHLALAFTGLEFNALLVPQATLQSLKISDSHIDSSSLTRLLRNFKELKFLVINSVKLTDGHVYDLCAACPRLEEVDLEPDSHITDEAIHHLLTTLPNLTSAKFYLYDAKNIIPLHVDNVNSNIQNMTWSSLEKEHNLVQLTKLHNLRSLTIECPERYLKEEEMEAICSGFEKLEEIHFPRYDLRKPLNVEVLEEEMKKLLQAKPSLRLVTIHTERACTGRIGEMITLEKKNGMIVRSKKLCFPNNADIASLYSTERFIGNEETYFDAENMFMLA